jgi:hypothetical protein
LTHEKCLLCSTCNSSVHQKCLPLYLPDDVTYASNPVNQWSCTTCLQNLFPFYNIETDSDIHSTIINHNHIGPDLNILDELIFNPFNDDTTESTDELDPDQNFYQSFNTPGTKSCKYYYPDQINSTNLNTSDALLSMFHLNVRSLPKNIRQLQNVLDITDHTFHTISLTETWLKDHNVESYAIGG